MPQFVVQLADCGARMSQSKFQHRVLPARWGESEERSRRRSPHRGTPAIEPEACALWSCYFQLHSIATRLGQMPLLLCFFQLPLLQCSGPKKRKKKKEKEKCFEELHKKPQAAASRGRTLLFLSEYVSNWRKLFERSLQIVLAHYNDVLCRLTQLAICYNVCACAFRRFNLHSFFFHLLPILPLLCLFICRLKY